MNENDSLEVATNIASPGDGDASITTIVSPLDRLQQQNANPLPSILGVVGSGLPPINGAQQQDVDPTRAEVPLHPLKGEKSSMSKGGIMPLPPIEGGHRAEENLDENFDDEMEKEEEGDDSYDSEHEREEALAEFERAQRAEKVKLWDKIKTGVKPEDMDIEIVNPVDERRKHILPPLRLRKVHFFSDLRKHMYAELLGNCLAAWKFGASTLRYIRCLEDRCNSFDAYGNLESLYLKTNKALKETKKLNEDLAKDLYSERAGATILVKRLFGTRMSLKWTTGMYRNFSKKCANISAIFDKYREHANWCKKWMAGRIAYFCTEMEDWRDRAYIYESMSGMFVELYRRIKYKFTLAVARGGKQAELIMALNDKIKQLEGIIQVHERTERELRQVIADLEFDKKQLLEEELGMAHAEIETWRWYAQTALTGSIHKLAAINWRRVIEGRKARAIMRERMLHLNAEMAKINQYLLDGERDRMRKSELEGIRYNLEAQIIEYRKMEEKYKELQADYAYAKDEIAELEAENKHLTEMKITKPTLPAKFLCARCCEDVAAAKAKHHELREYTKTQKTRSRARRINLSIQSRIPRPPSPEPNFEEEINTVSRSRSPKPKRPEDWTEVSLKEESCELDEEGAENPATNKGVFHAHHYASKDNNSLQLLDKSFMNTDISFAIVKDNFYINHADAKRQNFRKQLARSCKESPKTLGLYEKSVASVASDVAWGKDKRRSGFDTNL